MKKLLLSFLALATYSALNAQCTPNQQYQDSLYNIWPDTITNLPYCQKGAPYLAVLDIKTPTTLIEASGGDSSLTVLDTLGQTFYVGDWQVDSMELVQIIGLPSGLNLTCYNEPNCVLEGDILTCAYLDGTTNDPPGIYPIEIIVNVYTQGPISYTLVPGLPPITVNVPPTSLYDATGDYESVTGYEIIVGLTGNYELNKTENFSLLQNIPNPSNGKTNIRFNTAAVEIIDFSVYDLFGKLVHQEKVNTNIGLNTIIFENSLPEGMYTYSVSNGTNLLSGKITIISDNAF